MSNTLSDQWRTFLDNLQLPAGPVQAAFEYGLTRLLVEAGEIAEVTSPRPDISPAQEAMVLDHLRWLLGQELYRA